MRIRNGKHAMVSLVEDYPSGIHYGGPAAVDQFQIDDTTTASSANEEETTFNFTILMHRQFADGLLTTFFPTFLLWLLAYLTLFITLENFNERIMVSVTALLVLAAVLGSIKSGLPNTSYFKYIDLWGLWYTTNIFLITAFHITADRIEAGFVMPQPQSESATQVIAWADHGPTTANAQQKLSKASKQMRMNKLGIIFFPTITITFNLIYFIVNAYNYSI